MKKKLKLLLFLTMIILASASYVSATTAITPKYCEYTTRYSTANKKAKKISTGTYLVNINNAKESYLKFTPSSTGTYVFTISALKDSRDHYRCGHVSFHLKDANDRLVRMSIKTQGGTNNVLKIATEDGNPDKGDPAKIYLRSRYARVSLKKGKPIFLYYSFMGGKSFKINIRKKA